MTEERVSDARVRTLVLARLLPRTKRPLNRSEVIASVQKALEGAGDVEAVLTRAIDEGLIARSPLALSELGREALRQELGGTLPTPKDWRAVQRTLLAQFALGLERPRGADMIAGAILARANGWPAKTTLKAAVDRLCWQKLGVETDQAFDVTRVQRFLLRDVVAEDARVDAATFRRMLAVRAVGAKASDADSLRKAAVRRWLRSDGARVANSNGETKPATLQALANAVVHAAREPDVARFHDDRAFIGSIWEHMRGRAPVGDMPLDEFKAQLVAAHRAGLLRMTRADLAGAVDPSELARSEATHLGSTFHFVALDAAGGR